MPTGSEYVRLSGYPDRGETDANDPKAEVRPS
jgi:hypothetical protein